MINSVQLLKSVTELSHQSLWQTQSHE